MKVHAEVLQAELARLEDGCYRWGLGGKGGTEAGKSSRFRRERPDEEGVKTMGIAGCF